MCETIFCFHVITFYQYSIFIIEDRDEDEEQMYLMYFGGGRAILISLAVLDSFTFDASPVIFTI